jgi:SAM-dependent methyltransferase
MGSLIGRLMDLAGHPLRAYSINLAGSLIGIWIFSFISFLSLPPVYWFIPGMLIMLLLVERRMVPFALGLFAIAVTFVFVNEKRDESQSIIWSPYQKLVVRPALVDPGNGSPLHVGYVMEVNQTFYQRILNLSNEFRRAHPDLFPPEEINYDHYDVTYLFARSPRNVLVVGAGTGNDVAAALRHGAQAVDAVEIDPMIVETGIALHPEKPYQSPKVNVIVDDARSYFKKSDKQYDLIVFGLLDSHTLTSSFTNVRLDNYVYTVEGLQDAKRHLTPDGLLVLMFEVPRDWFGLRIANMMANVFQEEPVYFRNRPPHYRGIGGVVFIAGSQPVLQGALQANAELRRFVAEHRPNYTGKVTQTTDDWPYLYLRRHGVTKLYLVVIGVLVALTLSFSRTLFAKDHRLDWHFFFLGAAFLLVEVQSISKVALLFGTTWLVNSIIISAILLMILAANYFVIKKRFTNLKLCYSLLLISLGINYLLPLDLFLFIGDFTLRGIVASGILTLPMFFAGIIFATSFKEAQHVESAFGSNLIGAILGGLLECLSFVVGIQALLLIAGVLYVASFLGGFGAGGGSLRAWTSD